MCIFCNCIIYDSLWCRKHPVALSFTSAILEDKSKFQISTSQGYVSCNLTKDKNQNQRSTALPLRVLYKDDLESVQTFRDSVSAVRGVLSGPGDHAILHSFPPSGDAFMSFRKILSTIMVFSSKVI